MKKKINEKKINEKKINEKKINEKKINDSGPDIAQEPPVFEATLVPAQLFKGSVRLDVLPFTDDLNMHEQSLTFDRKLLPADYERSEEARFKLVITRMDE